jgi:UDP-N-acetylmuramoylalanine--D-glutamate ligase
MAMLPNNRFEVSLFGYGVTTKALAAKIGPCTIYDDHVVKPFSDAHGNRLKPSGDFEPHRSVLEIPSPGMPPKHPLITSAQHLMSEYDFFADTMPYSVWISGTNGKTTTTQMLTHMLKDEGALSGGNIGTPLADLDPTAAIWVLETSSFTLHYTKKAVPNLYALLPISPDHLSWHGSMESYTQAKLEPLRGMKEGEAAIIPNALLPHLPQTTAWIVGYDDAQDLAKRFGIDIEKIRFKGGFLLDAVIAMAVDAILHDRRDYERINGFVLDPHRQEEFYDAAERLWVNDTKATNIDATLAAMEAYKDKKVHLILGGDDKGVDLDPLFEALKCYDVSIYAIGSNETRLIEAAHRYGIVHTACSTLDKAVVAIAEKHTEESVALLSPAAASLDQFSSYAERGNLFKEFVARLS